MKIGFSTICCPAWDLKTIFEKAVGLAVDGIELRGLQGELHLPHHPELAQQSELIAGVSRKTKVELTCLGTSASFGFKKTQEVGDQKAVVREHIELAQKLSCPFVRVFTGDIPSGSSRDPTLGLIVEALTDLAHFAAGCKVSLLVENSGDLSSSKDLWFLLDAVSYPTLQACWNPINGLSVGDRSSIAIPRLGSRLGMVHVADGAFDRTVMQSYTPLGAGDVDVTRLVELLMGIAFDGFLMVEWPRLWDQSLMDADKFLPPAVKYLRDILGLERKPLAAYKGDKNAPKYGQRAPRVPLRD